jgi:hypothetical protein
MMNKHIIQVQKCTHRVTILMHSLHYFPQHSNINFGQSQSRLCQERFEAISHVQNMGQRFVEPTQGNPYAFYKQWHETLARDHNQRLHSPLSGLRSYGMVFQRNLPPQSWGKSGDNRLCEAVITWYHTLEHCNCTMHLYQRTELCDDAQLIIWILLVKCWSSYLFLSVHWISLVYISSSISALRRFCFLFVRSSFISDISVIYIFNFRCFYIIGTSRGEGSRLLFCGMWCSVL